MDLTYLVFSHRAARYGLAVRSVRGIVWLPELSPIEELPPYVAGVFSLHGRVVPVMDLCRRFGHAREPYCLGDRVIVIDGNAGCVGVIANELHEVVELAPAAIHPASDYQGAGGVAQFVFGEARLDGGLVMLLDAAALLRSAPPDETLTPDVAANSAEQLLDLYGDLAPEDAEAFRQRTRRLAEIPAAEAPAGLEAYAVVRLAGELFGLRLDVVREFSRLRGMAPVPCCPPHIVGNMNLRGDILTLVDLRPVLGMTTEGALTEVVVVRAGDLCFGLSVTEIVEVVRLAPTDVAAVPVASERAGRAHCSGVATVGGLAVGILDLERMLAARALQVAEQV